MDTKGHVKVSVYNGYGTGLLGAGYWVLGTGEEGDPVLFLTVSILFDLLGGFGGACLLGEFELVELSFLYYVLCL